MSQLVCITEDGEIGYHHTVQDGKASSSEVKYENEEPQNDDEYSKSSKLMYEQMLTGMRISYDYSRISGVSMTDKSRDRV